MPIDTPDDPFEAIIREQDKLLRRIKATETKETPLYQKGTFSPTLVGSGTAGTFTYGSGNVVEWTRDGNRLHYNGRLQITGTSVNPVGNMTINGWPFAGVADTNSTIAGIGTFMWTFITLVAGYTVIHLQFNNGSSVATLVRSGSNVALAIVQGAELTSGGGTYDFRFGGNYRIF